MLTQEEFDGIMLHLEQQFELQPYKFLSMEKICKDYISSHGNNKNHTKFVKEVEEALIEKLSYLKIDPLRRMNAIYRCQILFPKKCHEEFMSYGIQVGENGRVQELHWSDTIYFGEPMRENVIAYLEELGSTSLRYRTIEELAKGYKKWREANLNLKTPIEVKPYLHWRIPEILEDVMKMESLSDVLKVTIMMLTGTTTTKEFRNRLNKLNKIITDDEERIVYFQEKKNTEVELQQSYSQQGLCTQQLPIEPEEAADMEDILPNQIVQYLRVLQNISETETVPLSIQEIEAAYNRSIPEPSSRIQNLVARISRLNEEIFNFDEVTDGTKIKMLFATQTPVIDRFREKLKALKTLTGLNLDEYGRIIKFHSKDPNDQLRLEREIIWDSNSILNPVPWRVQEIKEFFAFFDAEARRASATMNLQTLCVEYMGIMGTKRTWAQLYDKFHQMISGNMESVPWLEYIRKAYILFAFGISPHPELLRKFYKKFSIQLNSEQKIIYGDCRVLKDGFGKIEKSRPLSRPDHQENYKMFLKKIAQRNDPMTKNEMVLEFLLDYPHFDTRGNVEKFFGDMDYKFLNNTIKNSDLLLKVMFVTQTKKPTKAKMRPGPQKRRRSVTPPDQRTGKNYRSRPRGEPRSESVEEKPSARINPESVPETDDAHHEVPQPSYRSYDDYEYFDQGNNEDQPMEIDNPLYEDREQNNQINNVYTEGNGLIIDQIEADDNFSMVYTPGEDGNREPTVHKEVHATESNSLNSHNLLDSTNNEDKNVETGSVGRQSVKSAIRNEEIETQNKFAQQNLESRESDTGSIEINDNQTVATEGDLPTQNDNFKMVHTSDSTNIQVENVEFIRESVEEKLISTVRTQIDDNTGSSDRQSIGNASRFEEIECQNKFVQQNLESRESDTGRNQPESSGTERKLVESQGNPTEISNGGDHSTVSKEITSTETKADKPNEKLSDEIVAVTLKSTLMNTDNEAIVSEKANSSKNYPVSQSAEHIPVPSQVPRSTNHAPIPEAETGAPSAEQQGCSGTEVNDDRLKNSVGTSQETPQEEETYDRKEAMRLVLRIYDSLSHNSEMKKDLKRAKTVYDKVKEGERISMKSIVAALKRSLVIIERSLCNLELLEFPNSYTSETVFVLFSQMAKSLESSLSEEIIQKLEALQTEKHTERLLIGPLLGLMSSLFLRLLALPTI